MKVKNPLNIGIPFESFQEKAAIWVRWAVLLLAISMTVAQPEKAAGHTMALQVTLAVAVAYNLLIFLADVRILKFLRRGWITLILDLLFATMMVAYTSGSQSEYFYLYYLAIFWAAVGGSRQLALKVTALATLMFIAALHWRGELGWQQAVTYDLVFKIALLTLTAFWAGLISDQQKQWLAKNKELSLIAQEWTKTASDIQAAALFGIGALMSSSKSIEETLNLTLDAVEDIVQADRCSILLLDNQTGELVLRAARGVRAGAVGKLRLKSDQGIAGEVLRTGEPLNVPDTDNEPLFVPAPKGYDKIRSMLVVPLIINDKRIGVINISEIKEKRSFSESELSAIRLVTRYAAIALSNAGLMEEKEREATTDGLTGPSGTGPSYR